VEAVSSDDAREISFIRDTGDPWYGLLTNPPQLTAEQMAGLVDIGQVHGGPLDGARIFIPRVAKAEHIPAEEFLDAVRITDPVGGWRIRDRVHAELERRLGPISPKVAWAKARILIDRAGTLHGCPCGCRGDYHLPEECRGC
jgi:hypothetical protein